MVELAMRLDPEMHKERLRMYDEGYSDVQIAEAQCVTKAAIHYWRKVHGLKAKVPRGYPMDYYAQIGKSYPVGRKISKETHEKRLKYYKMGYNDTEIAEILHCSSGAIGHWRRINELPGRGRVVNPNRVEDKDGSIRYKLWKEGKTDREIAELTGYSITGICDWRFREGYAVNPERRRRK